MQSSSSVHQDSSYHMLIVTINTKEDGIINSHNKIEGVGSCILVSSHLSILKYQWFHHVNFILSLPVVQM